MPQVTPGLPEEQPISAPQRQPVPLWLEPPLPSTPVPETPGGASTVVSNRFNGEGAYLVGAGCRIPILYGRLLIVPDIVRATPDRSYPSFTSVISEGPIFGIEEWFGVYGNGSATLPGGSLGANPTTGPANSSSRRWLTVASRTGTLGQTTLDSLLGPMPGVALVMGTANAFGVVYPAFIAKGRLLFDPRLGAWGAGEYPDDDYCAYSANAALIMADIRTNPQYGLGTLPGEVNWTSVSDAAYWCEEPVDGEPRGEVNLYIRDVRTLREWEETVGLHVGLRWRQVDGLWCLDRSEPIAAVSATITSDLVVAGSSPRVSYGAGAGFADLPNRVTVEWTDPASGWTVRQFTVNHEEVDAGAAVREGSPYRLHGLLSEKAAARAAWRILRGLWAGLTLDLDLMPAMAGLQVSDRVTVDLPELGLSTDFVVASLADTGSTVRASLRAYDASTWAPPTPGTGALPDPGFFDPPADLAGADDVPEETVTDHFDMNGMRDGETTYRDFGLDYDAVVAGYGKDIVVRFVAGAGTQIPRALTGFTITSGGSGHSLGETVEAFKNGGGWQAVGTVSGVSGGAVTAINLTYSGEDFVPGSSLPQVRVGGVAEYGITLLVADPTAAAIWDHASAVEWSCGLDGNVPPGAGERRFAISPGLSLGYSTDYFLGGAAVEIYYAAVKVRSLAGVLSAGLVYWQDQGSIAMPVGVSFPVSVPEGVQKLHGVPRNSSDGYDFTVSYDQTTRVLTMTPTATSFSVWLNGYEKVFTGAQAFAAHANTTGGYFFYIGPAGTLEVSTTFWDLRRHAPIAYVYYNATTAKGIIFEERHTAARDAEWHIRTHLVDGTQVVSGFGISGYTLNTATDAGVTFALAEGVIADEDLQTTIAALADATSYTIWERSGASGEWKWTTGNTLPFFKGTTYPVYNAIVTGSWARVELASAEWVNYYVFAVPSPTSGLGIAIVPGQAKHTSLSSAQAESVGSIAWGTIPFQEIAPLYRLTFRAHNSYGGTAKAQLQDVQRLVGNRVSLTVATPSSHNALSGRSDADAHPASAVTFTPYSTLAATTVQAAIQELLDEMVSGGGKVLKAQEFTSGTTNWTAPTGVTEVWVTGCAGGGGGGGVETDTAHGGAGGGGGGDSVLRKRLAVTASTGYSVAIGAAGAKGTSSATAGSVTDGSAGGSTSFGALLTLSGGSGGAKATGTSAGLGGAEGGSGGTRGTDGFPPITGAAGPNHVNGVGGVSFPGGHGSGGNGEQAGKAGYLLVEWNE